MAQYTGAVSWKDSKIEISFNSGGAFDDISGWASELQLPPGVRKSGEIYTSDGDIAVITAGKREPMEIVVMVGYSEGASDVFETTRASWESGETDVQLQWSPKCGGSTTFLFTTTDGLVSQFGYPAGQAEDGSPLVVQFAVKVPSVVKSVVA